jgi:hypothetical protein
MEAKLRPAFGIQTVDPGIAPHIASISPKFAQLNIIDMRSLALLQDHDELVLGPIK